VAYHVSIIAIIAVQCSLAHISSLFYVTITCFHNGFKTQVPSLLVLNIKL